MEDLQLSESTVQWLQSIFMLVNGIMIPITAFLIERFTTRKLFLTAMSLFAFGTAVAAVAPSFSLLLIGRVFQDRKSTRLNSSHVAISYAAFCWKKKKVSNKINV